ncbi:MAG TPA: DUF933 domain-containing protein [Bryobacteraceae bacterium]|nr:DUF933 domain-containing protein [Bryobacteraceae bacterium]
MRLPGQLRTQGIGPGAPDFRDACAADGYPGVREKGLLRLEGKEYIVKDGDVLVIRHV